MDAGEMSWVPRLLAATRTTAQRRDEMSTPRDEAKWRVPSQYKTQSLVDVLPLPFDMAAATLFIRGSRILREGVGGTEAGASMAEGAAELAGVNGESPPA